MFRTKIYRNLSWLFIDRLIKILGGLIVAVWVARYLGPENYGVLNFGLAYAAFFTLFIKLGLDKIVVREIVNNPDKEHLFLGTAFYIKFCGALISFGLIATSLVFYKTDPIIKWTIILVSSGFLFQSFDVIDFYYQSTLRSKYVVFSRNLAFVISSTLKIYYILYEFSVLYFASVVSFELMLSAIFLIVAYTKNGKKLIDWRFDKKIAVGYLRDSWPLALNIFLVSIHVRIDQAMIKSMLDLKQLGIFSVAVKIAEYWYFIPGIIIQTLMPYFVKLRQINYIIYVNRLVQLYSIMFWMGILIGIISVLLGKQLIIVLFGVEYINAYQALVYNIWKGIFISQAVAAGIWIINENVQLYRLMVNLMAVATNIILNIIFIPKMGISGAGLASLISIGISTWFYAMLFKPLKKSTYAMIKSIAPIYLFRRDCGLQ